MIYTFSITVPDYLKEWCQHHLGNPVEFPRDSTENRLIKLYIDKKSNCAKPSFGNLEIKIPQTKQKDPRSGYIYMSPRSQQMIVECIETLFIQNLWAELGSINKYNCQLTTAIFGWLEKHGMSDKHWECVRQKYYRLRKLYAEKGIKLKDY